MQSFFTVTSTFGFVKLIKRFNSKANSNNFVMSNNKSTSVSLPEVASWNDYFLKHKDSLKDLLAKYGSKYNINEPYEINQALNDKVSIWKGNITSLQIDAIVNAANKKLLGGGGVDGAIHKAAGPELLIECRTLNGCATGQAKMTRGYKLPAKHVIHTVGPQEEKKDDLESCYTTSLDLLVENGLRSIAFPCISTGIYGYPQLAAAKVALSTARQFLEKSPDSIDRIIFCLFLPEDVKIYETLMQQVFPVE